MQQALASQQATSGATIVKSATEAATLRAAEISKRLKGEFVNKEEKEPRKTRRQVFTLMFIYFHFVLHLCRL